MASKLLAWTRHFILIFSYEPEDAGNVEEVAQSDWSDQIKIMSSLSSFLIPTNRDVGASRVNGRSPVASV